MIKYRHNCLPYPAITPKGKGKNTDGLHNKTKQAKTQEVSLSLQMAARLFQTLYSRPSVARTMVHLPRLFRNRC